MTKTLGQVAYEAWLYEFNVPKADGRTWEQLTDLQRQHHWEVPAQAVWRYVVCEKLEALVKTFRAEERIFNQHACDTSPDGDEHWYYKVESRVWGQAADELQKAIALEALDKAEE